MGSKYKVLYFQMVTFSMPIYKFFHLCLVAINTDGSSADASAMLDIKSDTGGLLIPRITLTSNHDTTTIATPATSSPVYNTTSGCRSLYNKTTENHNNAPGNSAFSNGIAHIRTQRRLGMQAGCRL